MTFGDIREIISQTELVAFMNEEFEYIMNSNLCYNVSEHWNNFEVLAVHIHKQFKILVIILNTKGGQK